jgi:hypothetical protein
MPDTVSRVAVRPYLSPTLVLLAFDWQEGRGRTDFLGFAIQRSPGFGSQKKSWLPNRISFDGPAPDGKDLPSNENPIQKFMWWDARIDSSDRGKDFTYTLTPVVGTPSKLQLLEEAASELKLTIPPEVENGIGSYFNRAVVSSQAFMKEFGPSPKGKVLDQALAWLANGMEKVIPGFVANAHQLDGVIYHLTDEQWVLPALHAFSGEASIVYNKTTKDDTNGKYIKTFADAAGFTFTPRTKASISHDKFLVNSPNGDPASVLMGSANFTTEGLTSQANVLHTWESPELAALYKARHDLLAKNPALAATRQKAGWSKKFSAGDATVRVFFPPEKKPGRTSVDPIVEVVENARQSVIFCLFSSTDEALRDACFKAGDAGKMMFGIVNLITEPKETAKPTATTTAAVELFHRSREDHDVVGHDNFQKGSQPSGFWWEIKSVNTAVSQAVDLEKPKGKFIPQVFIHHKFVVVDAETANPIIYTGSANISGNSMWMNDENILEITDCPRLARIYFAEFMRLYEHYRARVAWNRRQAGDKTTFRLDTDTGWAAQAYQPGTPEYKARVNMASPLPATPA